MIQAYFDCFSGISGDMTLGALIDLGVPLPWLQDQLSNMPLSGFQIAATPVVRNGITAIRVTVEIDDLSPSRDFKQIKSLLENSCLSENVKSNSLSIFEKLAHAEADIHGCAVEEVHFHEVGGIDAIVDIVGTALCLEKLGIQKVRASAIPLGAGFVTSQHGNLPVPAPATLEILKDVPVCGTDIAHELVTPTGAAILVCLAESFGPLPAMRVKKIGYGAGQRELQDRPNLLRIISGTPAQPDAVALDGLQADQVTIIETCIDDMNPELFGFMMERLFADGALDVYWIPIHMKKSRPGTMVQVLCKEDRKDRLIGRILAETTSLGVRHYTAHRKLLVRDHLTVTTSFGEIQIKRVKNLDGSVRFIPEYEACKEIALTRNIPLRVVYDTVAKEAAASDNKGR